MFTLTRKLNVKMAKPQTPKIFALGGLAGTLPARLLEGLSALMWKVPLGRGYLWST